MNQKQVPAQNNMPPKDISAPELWVELTKMPRAHVVVDFPRPLPDGRIPEVAIVVLTQEEGMRVNMSTEKFVRKFFGDSGAQIPKFDEMNSSYSTLYENRASCELLFLCCKRVDDLSKPFFPTVEAISRALTTDEIGVMMKHYVMTQSKLGPITSKMSQEEYDAWIDKLAEGGSAFPLNSLSLGAMIELIMYMALQIFSSRTDKSSAGTLQEENS